MFQRVKKLLLSRVRKWSKVKTREQRILKDSNTKTIKRVVGVDTILTFGKCCKYVDKWSRFLVGNISEVQIEKKKVVLNRRRGNRRAKSYEFCTFDSKATGIFPRTPQFRPRTECIWLIKPLLISVHQNIKILYYIIIIFIF